MFKDSASLIYLASVVDKFGRRKARSSDLIRTPLPYQGVKFRFDFERVPPQDKVIFPWGCRLLKIDIERMDLVQGPRNVLERTQKSILWNL